LAGEAAPTLHAVDEADVEEEAEGECPLADDDCNGRTKKAEIPVKDE